MATEKPKPPLAQTFRATVTEGHTIELPADRRRQLANNRGDAVEIVVEGNVAQLRKAVDDPVLVLCGLLRDHFTDWYDINRFVQEERANWSDRPHPLPLDSDAVRIGVDARRS